jgi:hypothetical protein
MEKANSTANIEHVLAKGSYLYRSSTISGDFNNAQKPFQRLKPEIALIN